MAFASVVTEAEHILVVDDDPDVRAELREYLAVQGYRVSAAGGGASMRRVLDQEAVDLIILDLMMPGEDGLSLTRMLRKTTDVAIIILTGAGSPVDQVVCLELGADDYLSKPCDLRQLLARVRSVLRRTTSGADRSHHVDASSLKFGGWTINLPSRQLTRQKGTVVPLTTAEFNLLKAFATNANRALSRDQILDMTKGRGWSPYDRSVDNLVSRLRRKIEADPKYPTFIRTVQGVGYIFTPDAPSPQR